MKKLLLATLAFSTILQSCGVKPTVNPGKFKNSVKLGKFSDIVTRSTFDESLLTDIPRAMNLRSDMSPVKDQSDRGSCTFFSTAGLLESVIKKDQLIDVNLSEEYMTFATKNAGYYPGDEGSTVHSNIWGINKKGLMLERDSGYQPSWFAKGLPCEKYKSTDAYAPRECFSHKSPDADKLKNVISADSIEFIGFEKDTNEIIRFLAEQKRPLTLGIAVNFNGWPQDGNVFYNEELRAECLADESKCGGHSILITGYDLDKKVFFFKNSWGTGWGDAGFGTMTIETVDLYASPDLYSAKLNDKLNIPENAAETAVDVKSLSFEAKRSGDKLSVDVQTEISGARGRLIYISSFLAKKINPAGEAVDANMQLVSLTPEEVKATEESYVRSVYYDTNPKTDILSWTTEAPLSLNFVKGTVATIKSVLNSADETLLRTTVYVHTDDSSWKVLKRVYSPLKK